MNKKYLFIIFTLLFLVGFTMLYFKVDQYTIGEASLAKSFITALGITIGIIVLNYKHIKKLFK